MKEKIKQIHLIGIAGSGMSGIAQVLHNQNYLVSGSDLHNSSMLRQLGSLGIKTYVGHKAEQVENADVVVISSAIKEDNIEVIAARAKSIPVVPRAVMLAELMRLKRGIAVAGTHGKTTTTSLIAQILAGAGLDPTYVIGGRLNGVDDNARVGAGKYLVAEADESDASFLNLNPIISVVTNIDQDHMQTYDNSFDKLKQTFINFLQKLPFYGTAVLCADDKNIQQIIPQISRPLLTYGFQEQVDIRAVDVIAVGSQMKFTVQRKGQADFAVLLNLPGLHNVLNALAAIAVASLLEIEPKMIQQALTEFKGVNRRFQRYPDLICGDNASAVLIDDYGHHPEEMRATIAAARGAFPGRRLVVAFQPHRYSRTRDCFEDFVKVLGQADLVLLTEVYAAGEEPIIAADGRSLTRAVRIAGKVEPIFVEDVTNLATELSHQIKGDDVVLCMGAGSIGKISAELVKLMQGEQDE